MAILDEQQMAQVRERFRLQPPDYPRPTGTLYGREIDALSARIDELTARIADLEARLAARPEGS